MKPQIKIFLVEDNPEYRHVIDFSLKDDPEQKLIAQFGTAEQALRSLSNRVTRDVPDVILLDLNLPGISGIDAISEFIALSPLSKIIVLTQSENEAHIMEAIRSGASGYLLKSSSLQEIKSGIRIVMEGGAPIDPKMACYLLDLVKTGAPSPGKESLTEREFEILVLISEGQARKQISGNLSISTKTVDNHIAHIFEKLNVPNSASAVAKAYQTGLFPRPGH